MKPPLEDGILGHRYNATLHGRSVHRPTDVPGHNVVLGYSRPGIGDALDIFKPAGTPIHAMHDGSIGRIADPSGKLSCVYVVSPKGITTVYAHLHIKDGIRLGTKVKEGDLLGWVGEKVSDPHLHLEIWQNGRSISAEHPADLAKAMAALCK